MRGFFCILLVLTWFGAFSQTKIHSHNDYVKKQPFFEAYNNKADEIEADVFLVDGKLVVAHSRKEIDTSITLDKLYLQPIVQLFKKNNGFVSSDKSYTFSLMIDVKDDWDKVSPVLKANIEQYGNVFDRTDRKTAIQIVISGNRPPHVTFKTYPNWLFFDGLPNINYSKKDLKKVALISDNFANSSKWNGIGEILQTDVKKLKQITEAAHQLKKPVRFWGAPDGRQAWQKLRGLGVDVINTDKVADLRSFLSKTN